VTTRKADIGSPETFLGFLLNQLGGIVQSRTALALKPLGMSPRSFGFLLALADEPGASQTALGRRLAVDRTTMSQLVDELTQAGHVRRSVVAADRRTHQLALTAKGTRTLERAVVVARDVERAVRGDIGEKQLATLRAGLLDLLSSARGSVDETR
jgi:DNA-binding MarR family transcriptional regulator